MLFINKYLNKYEHMSMKDPYLNQVLINNNYIIDTDKLIIKKCENGKCYIKEYQTKHFNSLEAHRFAKNKALSNKTYMDNGIPVPKHSIITIYNKDEYLNNPSIQYPCVLKPIDGMQGKDVNTFIKNNEEFNSILITLLSKYNSIMYEEQVYGDNYRIFVFNNKVIDVIKREQPYIIGNGKNSIEQLINIKNNEQLKKKLYATTNISWNYINDKGYKKDSILENNKKLYITNTINFHNGANPVRVNIDKIPIENINIFIKAHKLGNLECSGIDYMSNDITVPYYLNNGHIIEINDMVDTKIHIEADNKNKPLFLYENILKNLF
jgi:cyanophycin synthetase